VSSVPRHGRAPLLLAAGLAAGVAAGVGAAWLLLRREPPPGAVAPPAAAPAAPASPSSSARPAPAAAQPSAWRELPASSSLARFADVAFSPDGLLVTDGSQAHYEPAGREARPIEVPAALPYVFSAADRLFAAGENEGAPFLIGLSRDQAPLVVPMPCPAQRLAGAGETLVAACQGAAAVATSSNGGSRFRKVALELPAPPLPPGSRAESAIDALAAGADGSFALAVVQRWRAVQGADELLWSWAHVGLQPDRGDLAWRSVPGLARSVGLHLDGSAITLAGLEVAPSGPEQGELRPRFWRGGDAGALEPLGSPGPACGSVAQAEEVDGVLLGPREAAFRCAGEVVLTLDGGTTWWSEAGFAGEAERLRGGEMRLVVRAGGKVYERRFATRSPGGAVAVRLGPAPAPADAPAATDGADGSEGADAKAPPLSAGSEVREPEADPDAGE
jgi:hypothetical protein